MRHRKTGVFKRWALLALVLLLTAPAGCADGGKGPMVGGPCSYESIDGSAVITAITAPDPGEASCSNRPRKVLFDFIPEDPSKAGRFPAWPDTGRALTLPGGMNPPADWLAKSGLAKGVKIPCVRREITKGTCTPVLFDFPGLDIKAGVGACHAGQ